MAVEPEPNKQPVLIRNQLYTRAADGDLQKGEPKVNNPADLAHAARGRPVDERERPCSPPWR